MVIPKRRFAVAALAMGTLVASAAATSGALAEDNGAEAIQATLYVSSSGNDANPGTIDAPFETIAKARDVVRTLNQNMTGDIEVKLRGGDYEVTSTIDFTAADSGTNGHRVIYSSADGPGAARLIGGRRLTNWTRYSGNIYQTDVGSLRFNALYQNGRRAVKARTPNLDPGEFTTAQSNYLLTDSGSTGSTVAVYRPGDLDPSGWDLRDATMYVWPNHNWFAEHVPISAIDPSTRRITVEQAARYGLPSNSRYFIEGVLSLLDKPGEYHLDSATGTLYYWARGGAIAHQRIIAPQVRTILSLAGASESDRVHHITFSGLELEATEFTDWYRMGWPGANGSGENHEYSIYDRQIELPQLRTGMVFMTNTDHISLTGCRLRNSGLSAVFMLFYNQDNEVSSCLIEHVGYAGVFLEGRYPGEGDVLKNNLLTNNLIHDVGEQVGHGAGYLLMQSSGNELSYSEIYNSPRFGTYIAGYRDLPNSVLYSRDNSIHHLNIHDVMQDSRDGAGVYTFGVSSVSTGPFQVNTYDQLLVNYSWMHPSAANDQASNVDPAAVYPDEDSYGQRISNVEARNYQNTRAFRGGSSGSAVLSNVSWATGFDPARMDYANIGVRPSFPYPILRINAGSHTEYLDDPGQLHTADQSFQNGKPGAYTEPVAGTADQPIYANYRLGTFAYRVPLANGSYRVTLRFVEPLFTTSGARVFSVRSEGLPALTDFDVYAAAGERNRAVDRTITAHVDDGRLDLEFTPSVNDAILAGLTIAPG